MVGALAEEFGIESNGRLWRKPVGDLGELFGGGDWVHGTAIGTMGLIMHVHVLGACGTFMGGVAALARSAGHRVTGSDRNVYRR
ncbi:protein containing Mur ligase [mine drainage metagenome]|uniref:Protein containing Mur ligase n=1 Tax=mine drainage metagenome TaxID=410659 RepID=T0ZCC3_9ZZZZ